MRTNDAKLIVGHVVDLPEHAKGAQSIQLTATEGHAPSIKADLSGARA